MSKSLAEENDERKWREALLAELERLQGSDQRLGDSYRVRQDP